MSIHDELRLTLEREPESLRSDQLMEELFWEALELIEKPKRKPLVRLAEASNDLARQIFGRAKAEPATWQLWYAGQIQGIVGLLRILLSRQVGLETTAVLRSRKNVGPILKALESDDSRISDLAKVVDLDESQLVREIRVLARHNLIETVKEGRERWARITSAGRAALNEVIGPNLAASVGHIVHRTMPNEWVRKGVPVKESRSDSTLFARTFPNVGVEDLPHNSNVINLFDAA
jgi:DNA-binding PadR family transcriptional regulator